MRDNALAGAELFGADAAHPDTYLCVLPLFHSFGQTVIQNGAFAFGGTIVMLPRFEAHAASWPRRSSSTGVRSPRIPTTSRHARRSG